ncbi:hypothetical protein M9458_057525 [Cirrhinus mrigala]|uniref:PiggyBac transposable element-derived protein domain-containing protein n=1 Tax=Cirrhinus mrigala TaxID=683832 RepID=A0ABD0MEU8_CIRMR
MADSDGRVLNASGISVKNFYSRKGYSRSIEGKNRSRSQYRIIENIPEDSGSDSDSSDEYVPENSSSETESEAESEAESDAESDTESDTERPPERSRENEAQGEMAETHGRGRQNGRGRQSNKAWYKRDNNYQGVLPAFTGMFGVIAQGEEPIELFSSLFPDTLIDDIVFQSNMYALQQGKENLNLTSSELKTFLGINLMMTYVKYPRIRMYWSSNSGLRLPSIADAMSVDRFDEIKRYLHFVDNNSPADGSKFFKVRPVLNVLEATFLAAVKPEEYHAVDEQIIPFKGKHSSKQYIPKKPKPWGFKVWVRAGTSGYMYRFELYQGASGGRGDVGELGMAAEVVVRLCSDIHNNGHKVFFDNYFCSMPLLEKLREYGIESTERGTSSVVSTSDNITVTRWLDRSIIHIASTCAGKSPEDLAKRWSKKESEVIQIARPFAVSFYNSHMGGVDLVDQCLATYAHRRRNKRCYMRIFFHFLDIVCVNAWRLFQMKNSQANACDLLQFKASIAQALISTGSMEKRSRGRPSLTQTPKRRNQVNTPPVVWYGIGKHWPRSAFIKNAMRCRFEMCQKKTRYICIQCQVALCPDCFEGFHTK